VNGLLRDSAIPKTTPASQQVIVPQRCIKRVLKEAHDAPSGGHFGINKTLEKVRKKFYWATRKKDVEDWC